MFHDFLVIPNVSFRLTLVSILVAFWLVLGSTFGALGSFGPSSARKVAKGSEGEEAESKEKGKEKQSQGCALKGGTPPGHQPGKLFNS